MKQISSISFTALRNDEFYGLLSEGLNTAKNISDKEFKQAVEVFEVALKDLGSFLEASFVESSERKAKKLDAERNEIYKACRRVAQATTCFPDADAAETGAKIWKIFEESPSPVKFNQAQSTGILLNIIQGIKKIEVEKLEACNFKLWLDKLETVNNQYMEADMARYSERSRREIENCKRLRTACVDAYNLIVSAAYFKASIGSESCINFLECMDKAVRAKKTQLKIRYGGSKADEKNNSPTDNSAANSEANSAAGDAVNSAAGDAAPTTDNASPVGVENAA